MLFKKPAFVRKISAFVRKKGGLIKSPSFSGKKNLTFISKNPKNTKLQKKKIKKKKYNKLITVNFN